MFTSVILFYDDTWIYYLRPYRHWLIDFLFVAFSYLTTRRMVFHYEQSRIKGHAVGSSFRTAYMKVFFPNHKRPSKVKQGVPGRISMPSFFPCL
jgi:hypothetical protein